MNFQLQLYVNGQSHWSRDTINSYVKTPIITYADFPGTTNIRYKPVIFVKYPTGVARSVGFRKVKGCRHVDWVHIMLLQALLIQAQVNQMVMGLAQGRTTAAPSHWSYVNSRVTSVLQVIVAGIVYRKLCPPIQWMEKCKSLWSIFV